MISQRLFRSSSILIRKYKVIPLRYQSKKPNFPDINTIHDPKLREIIQGTNFGTDSLYKKQQENDLNKKEIEIEKEKKKLEQDRQIQDTRKEKKTKEDPLAKLNDKLDHDFSTTPQGQVQGVATDSHEEPIKSDDTEYKLKVEDKIIATTNESIDEEDIPNLAKEINETIQKEIGSLPSQKIQKQSQISKKITKYLDSLHDTILTATRALNDVTGYSAIEKLKKSIEDQEQQLKEAKDYVKKCKGLYAESIQKRSKSQREVNELLTRKHNWSSQDLERFTELYRNDHENEQNEEKNEMNLQDAESKVDSIQLKLTQSILTRYHEEQIWSDKIRKSSTWGTWVLMGLNVLLFVVATFIVEPWKRNKLVFAFEDKVKQVLVGISQDDKEVLEPIIEKLPEKPEIVPFEVVLPKFNWNSIKHTIVRYYHALINPNIDTLQFNKLHFEIFTAILTVFACSIGSIVTLIIHK
ncbi:unnamed protein product [Candida verbasci]|uniref:Sensitive to high expression protein 9, mitochondrial n=1 Tax=Candida verbasci TaxID=1227364 RepID=A0A9W4TSS7_9ASCO|nr:unnamed protein product [Candida verbasci]